MRPQETVGGFRVGEDKMAVKAFATFFGCQQQTGGSGVRRPTMLVEVESDPSPRRRTADTQQRPFGMPALSGMKGATDATESQPMGLTASDENSVNGTRRDDGFLAHWTRRLSDKGRTTKDEQGDT
jgi:hypothetical protein